MLSVCINHRNRSFCEVDGGLVPVFRRAYDALVSALDAAGEPAEIVIADWPGDVRLGLGSWCNNPCVRRIHCDGQFTRGGGRNSAAAHANGDVLFFMDADMLLVPQVIVRGLEIVRAGQAFFPFYKRLNRQGVPAIDGIGHGNAMVSAEHFRQSGGFPVKQLWGGEDTTFARWFDQRGLMVREYIDGFYHLWHTAEVQHVESA